VDLHRIREEISGMARDAGRWLDREALYARTVTIKVRYSDFTTITRSHSSLPATRHEDDLVRRATDLLSRTEAGRRPVRLLGVTVHNLTDVPGDALQPRRFKPLPLFDEE
jgi:DNA polymerase-4